MGNSQSPEDPPRVQRPLSVWLVSGWYFMSGFFSISMIGMVQSRVASEPVGALGASLPLKTIDVLLAAFLISLNLSGAGFLFFLKKTAVLFFKTALAVNIGTNIWYLFEKGMGKEPAVIWVGVVLGWLVAAMVCRYAENLAKAGVLR